MPEAEPKYGDALTRRKKTPRPRRMHVEDESRTVELALLNNIIGHVQKKFIQRMEPVANFPATRTNFSPVLYSPVEEPT